MTFYTQKSSRIVSYGASPFTSYEQKKKKATDDTETYREKKKNKKKEIQLTVTVTRVVERDVNITRRRGNMFS